VEREAWRGRANASPAARLTVYGLSPPRPNNTGICPPLGAVSSPRHPSISRGPNPPLVLLLVSGHLRNSHEWGPAIAADGVRGLEEAGGKTRRLARDSGLSPHGHQRSNGHTEGVGDPLQSL
jgi:hypothetical protein